MHVIEKLKLSIEYSIQHMRQVTLLNAVNAVVI